MCFEHAHVHFLLNLGILKVDRTVAIHWQKFITPGWKAWASLESGVQRALLGYCMLRFQKTPRTRWLSYSSAASTCSTVNTVAS